MFGYNSSGGSSYPDVSGDGLTPGGIIVAGSQHIQGEHPGTDQGKFGLYVDHALIAGQQTQTNIPLTHRMNGAVLIRGTQANADDYDNPLMVQTGSGTLTYDGPPEALFIARNYVLNGFHATQPILTIQDSNVDAQSGPFLRLVDRTSGTEVVKLDLLSSGGIASQAGIAAFGHAVPSAPRALAQSVITAITDTNTKTAVQACANALSDAGYLTLT